MSRARDLADGTFSTDLSVISGASTYALIDSDGLKFNGDTAAANALDDYEEGTFSPGITGWTGTYSNQDGIYTKVGDWVQVYGRVRTNASTGSFSDTYPGLSQLPFTSGVSVISAMGFGVWAAGTTSISSSQTCMVSFDSPNSGSNSAFPNWVVTGGNLSNFTNQHVLAGSAVELRFNCAYRTS